MDLPIKHGCQITIQPNGNNWMSHPRIRKRQQVSGENLQKNMGYELMLKSTVDSNEQSEHAAHVPPRPWVTRSCMILWGCPGHQLVIFSGHEKKHRRLGWQWTKPIYINLYNEYFMSITMSFLEQTSTSSSSFPPDCHDDPHHPKHVGLHHHHHHHHRHHHHHDHHHPRHHNRWLYKTVFKQRKLGQVQNVTSNQIYLVVNSHRYGKPIVSQETRSRHDGYTHANNMDVEHVPFEDHFPNGPFGG